jgi:uncharacterized membrane protein
MTGTKRRQLIHLNFQGNLLAGLLTVTPVIAVWLVFDFVLNVLSSFGRPLADRLTPFLDRAIPGAAPLLASPVARWLVAVAVALFVLYLVGLVASRVIGQRVIALFETIITRIPLVETIYSAVKKLVDVLQQRPGGDQRVALLDWPHADLKTVGFVMRSFADAKTGEEMAAVYVPSALNPTSGFLQILPMAKLTMLDVPTDQAMTMIISGGAIVPEKMSIAQPSG